MRGALWKMSQISGALISSFSNNLSVDITEFFHTLLAYVQKIKKHSWPNIHKCKYRYRVQWYEIIWKRTNIYKHLQLSPMQNDILSILMNTFPLHSACTHLGELAPLARSASQMTTWAHHKISLFKGLKFDVNMLRICKESRDCLSTRCNWRKYMSLPVTNTPEILFPVISTAWISSIDGSL